MVNESGKLTGGDLPILNSHFERHSQDGSLTCPVTGMRVPVAQWRMSERLCMVSMSGEGWTADSSRQTPLICCTSPAGGVLFLDAITVGLLKKPVEH